VVFLRDGRDLAVLQSHSDPAGPASVLLRVDGRTGAVERRPRRLGRYNSTGLFATADRRRAFATSPRADATYEIDPERLRVLRRHPVGDIVGGVSPDGRTFALGSGEGRVRLLDLRSGEVTRLRGRHDGPVLQATFPAGGRTLVTAGEDGKLLVWDIASAKVRETLSGHGDAVSGLEVSPDGRTLYSAAFDTRAFVWDLSGERRLVRPFEAGRPFVPDDGDEYPKELALSPNGRTLAVSQSDGTVDLIDTRTLRRLRSERVLRGFVAAVDFSPDGRLLAVTGRGGEAKLLDARSLRSVAELRGLRNTSQAIAFSLDGRLLAAADTHGGPARVWDVRRRAPTGASFRTLSPSLDFSPDGKLLALAAIERGFEIREARSGRLVKRLRTDEGRSVAFTPGGDLLATGRYDGNVQLWSTRSWRPVAPPLEGHDGRVLSLDFSPDGRTLLSASEDGRVLLRDVSSQRPIGSALTVDPHTFVSALFAPDGSRLFAVSAGERAVRLETSPAAWKRHACLAAGRDLTDREWRDALPDREYRPVCRRD
jgi:WD40 repeat protein